MTNDDSTAEQSPFVAIPQSHHVAANELAFAIRDRYPVSPGHTLVIPRRVIAQWWDASRQEQQAILDLVDTVRDDLLDDDIREQTLPGQPKPDGFNVGFNAGDAAGQTVNHLHLHVIPRYHGDMLDPRGGVRHVIPEKGNYLAPTVEPPTETSTTPEPTGNTQVPRTGLETSLTGIVEPTALITWLTSIVAQGRRTATYKQALLIAILDAAIEAGDLVTPTSVLTISLDDLAERVIALYWPQTRPNPINADGPLRQSGGRRLRIVNGVEEFRRAIGCDASTDIHAARRTDPVRYQRLHEEVKRALAKQPIPRLQRPGANSNRDGYQPWLYDDSGFRPEYGTLEGVNGITLYPGVAHTLATNAIILRAAIHSTWLSDVARYSAIDTEAQQLREFLFGAERTTLEPVREALFDVEGPWCFYCRKQLTPSTTHVDHVIPWSHLPLNDFANLVLSDTRCNISKSTHLISAHHVERWVTRDQRDLAQVAREINWTHDPQRTLRVAASTYRWHPRGIPVWVGPGSLVSFNEVERATALRLLTA